MLGICRTGGLIKLHLISLKESCCSFLQRNGLPFLVKSYFGFNNFYNSGQNILRKLIIPQNSCIPLLWWGVAVSVLPLTYFSKVACTLFCFRFVLNNWHFFREIFNPFFSNAFNRSSNLSM